MDVLHFILDKFFKAICPSDDHRVCVHTIRTILSTSLGHELLHLINTKPRIFKYVLAVLRHLFRTFIECHHGEHHDEWVLNAINKSLSSLWMAYEIQAFFSIKNGDLFVTKLVELFCSADTISDIGSGNVDRTFFERFVVIFGTRREMPTNFPKSEVLFHTLWSISRQFRDKKLRKENILRYLYGCGVESIECQSPRISELVWRIYKHETNKCKRHIAQARRKFNLIKRLGPHNTPGLKEDTVPIDGDSAVSESYDTSSGGSAVPSVSVSSGGGSAVHSGSVSFGDASPVSDKLIAEILLELARHQQ